MQAPRSPQRIRKHWQAGLAHAEARRWTAAATAFEQASALAPGDANVWAQLADAQRRSGRTDQAIAAASRAFALDSRSPAACRLLADCLATQHRHAEAAACYEQLAPAAPRDAGFLSAHGIALFNVGRHREAIDVFFLSLAQKIDAPLVHYRLGLTFMELAMKEEACECFRTAAALDEGSIRAMALTLLVHESAQVCRWHGLADDVASLRAAIGRVPPAQGHLLSPFALVSIDASPAEQRHVAAVRSQALARTVTPLPVPATPRAPGRIRIGYLSSDFYRHATAQLMADLLEQRDTTRFEVVLYCHSRDDGSELRARVLAACDRVVDVSAFDNAAVAERIRQDGIDILVDLKGHTRNSRFEVLAARPAPVQVSYLGYPGTTGADFLDYVVGDPVVTPLDAAAHFSEKIAQMPWSYQPNDRQRALPPAPTRAACGLPRDALVLCCFNQTYKLIPETLDAWARILHGAPNAVLWLLAWNEPAERHLRAELLQRGIDNTRVIFAPKVSVSDHVARLRNADLFLDTWPCNAHTTASEALWAGVPVLTHSGQTFASRVAASLARATHTEDLVCDTVDAYVAKALALAGNTPALRAIQQRLHAQRLELPLFDTPATAAALEALYVRMHDRHLAGLRPDHLPAAV